jgi:Na+/phosphate symporter
MSHRKNRTFSTAKQAGAGLAALLLFVLALELMKSGASGLTPLLRGHLAIQHAADCLGLGWLMACLVLSGSPAAAIAMVLLSADTLTQVQTFTMVTGSRLGASFIVLLLGFLYVLRGHERLTVLSTGVLSLLLTASVQLAALPVGVFILKQGWLNAFHFPWIARLSTGVNAALNPIMGPATALLPQWARFIVGAGLITVSFQLFDKALPQLRFDKAGLHRTSQLIYRPVVMFFLGLLVTILTLSVSVSIGILVPLSARGYVRRENIMPYILGANISTMIDTLGAAILLGTPQAVAVVLAHMIGAIIVSMPIVGLAYEPYKRFMSRALEWTLESRRNFGIFLGAFFLIPIALILS